MEDLKHSLNFTFCDQGYRIVGDKSLVREQLGAHEFAIDLFQVGDLDDAPFHDGPPGVTFANAQVRVFDVTRIESLPNPIFQPIAARLHQQNAGSIHLKLPDHFIDDDGQCDLELEHTANGKIDRTECGQSFQLIDGLFVQIHAVNGIATDLCQGVQDAELSRCKLSRQGHMQEQDAHNAVFGM